METNVPLQIPEESDSDAEVEQFFWDFMNDPIEAQIETQIRAQIEAEQRGTSTQYRRFRRRHIERDRGAARDRLMSDYFVENPVYNDFQFRRRYRMKRHLFLHIVQTQFLVSLFLPKEQCIWEGGLFTLAQMHRCHAYVSVWNTCGYVG